MTFRFSSFSKDTFVYGIGSLFSRLFAFFLIPFYIQSLGSEFYSNVVILQLVFTFVSYFLALNSGVFYYYYEPKFIESRSTIFSSWILYQFIFLFLAIPFFYLNWHVFDFLFYIPKGMSGLIQESFFYMLLSLVPYVINTTYYNFYRIERKPGNAVIITLLEALLSFVFIFYLVNRGLSIKGVFLGIFIGRLLTSVVSFIISKNLIKLDQFSFTTIKRLMAYSWPYLLISVFYWIISHIDKFIGTQLLSNRNDVAVLAFTSQITLPIVVLVDVIRQAFGPYVMSIRGESNSVKHYSELFSFVVYITFIASALLLVIAPYLIKILANDQFISAMVIFPLLVGSSVLGLVSNQLSLGLNLVRKNQYIAMAVIFGGVIGIVSNNYFQLWWGVVGAGWAQLVSYLIVTGLIYWKSNKYYKIEYDWKWILKMTIYFLLFIGIYAYLVFSQAYSELFWKLPILGVGFVLLMMFDLKRLFKKN